MRLLNLTGQRYGWLTVLTRGPNQGRKVRWVCRCKCGSEKLVVTSNLRAGKIVSCGCWSIENARKRCSEDSSFHTKHGHSTPRTPTYSSWEHMRGRCNNPNSNYYHIYGGRGISVCEEWDDFRNFLADMGERPKGKTIDRIDGNGNYERNDICRAPAH